MCRRGPRQLYTYIIELIYIYAHKLTYISVNARICKCIPQSRGRAHQRAGTERKRREPAQRAAAQKHCRRARPAKQRKAAPTKRQARVRKAKQVKRNAAERGTGGTKVAPGGLSHAPAALLFRRIHLQLDTRCSLQGDDHPSSLCAGAGGICESVRRNRSLLSGM